MSVQVTATNAKNNFGGLLELVAARGRVEITKHGRVIAVVSSPALAPAAPASVEAASRSAETHMIAPDRARAARMIRPPRGFGEP